jgi:hypothetical protein
MAEALFGFGALFLGIGNALYYASYRKRAEIQDISQTPYTELKDAESKLKENGYRPMVNENPLFPLSLFLVEFVSVSHMLHLFFRL